MAAAASSVSLASPSLPRTAAETRPILGPRWRSLAFPSRPVSASPLPLRSSLPPRAASVGSPALVDVAEGGAAARPSPPPPPSLPFRVGHGFDLHRLEPGLPLIIGGVDIPHDRGCEAHSDGDVLLHCVVDAILGALGLPDIGQIFPDSDPKWRGAASSVFLKEALNPKVHPVSLMWDGCDSDGQCDPGTRYVDSTRLGRMQPARHVHEEHLGATPRSPRRGESFSTRNATHDSPLEIEARGSTRLSNRRESRVVYTPPCPDRVTRWVTGMLSHSGDSICSELGLLSHANAAFKHILNQQATRGRWRRTSTLKA